MTQETLADRLGLTFQQVQKYERATNRISASKLFEIADALDVAPAYFFDGLPGLAKIAAQDPVDQVFALFLESDDCRRLVGRLARCDDRKRRAGLKCVFGVLDLLDNADEATKH